MVMKAALVFLLFVGSVNAWFWSKPKPKRPDWDTLRVTFLKFNKLPLSATDAKKNGWQRDKSCQDKTFFAGNRYVKEGDRTVMPLYDSDGKIAGIQLAIPKSAVSAKQNPWVSEGDYYVITAYFVNPHTICNGKRPDSEYIGDRLVIQMGSSTNKLMKIPYLEDKLSGTGWVKGKCFYWMGRHYWYKITSDMDCEEFFPVFLLYNKGRLNGFGWNTIGFVDSPRMEHPPQRALKRFFYEETFPKCVDSGQKLSTQHVYFDWPYNNFC